jgi:SAM-dependent methyltransferase
MTIQCDLCGGSRCEVVTDKLRYEADRKIYRCTDCGLQFLYPKMDPEKEREFYEKEYGNIFSNEKGTTPEQLFENRLPDARLYRDWVKEFLGSSDACIEVGCASGYFLATIQEHVGSVAGIETHHLLKAFCQKNGIEMFENLVNVPDGQYDKVFLFFVLEHIGDPIPFLDQMNRVLKPGGMIFIVVPNIDDALLSLYDIPSFRAFYYTPAHQFYYSKKTLGDLLCKAGFCEFEIRPIQRYDISNHMHWMMYGKPGGVGSYNHVFSGDLLSEYAENLKEHFICDTLFAIVKKP